MKEAGKELYPNEKIFDMISVYHPSIVPIYFFTNLGNVVVTNSTKYDEKELRRYGRSALIALPSYVTQTQILALKELMKDLENFSIEVDTNLKLVDGVVSSNSHCGIKSNEFDKILDIIGEECTVEKKQAR